MFELHNVMSNLSYVGFELSNVMSQLCNIRFTSCYMSEISHPMSALH